ncbi:MAG: ferrous iron transporter B, partial [Rikenellaceae bacterium]|jgi:ferrous iron transport protein B|nr:ferrous iron transporter B [Rikenellaceae bacterium]
MGFGCNVPAIMATRTLESRKDRLLTTLIIPFISCSARLPVYVLFISAFFVKNGGLVLVSIYLIGITVAVLTSLLLKRVFFRKEEAPFVMELPPYRVPTTRNVVRHMWGKGAQYLKKMGNVILIASVLIWVLGHYPLAKPGMSAAEQQENSYIGRLGKAVEPAIRPLGFDWQVGVSLITGFAAKEVVVSTMAVLAGNGQTPIEVNGDGEADEAARFSTLKENLKTRAYTYGPRAGQPVFSPLVAYALMIFILIYVPCIAVITAIWREAGWRWALFSVFYTTGMAWLLAFAVYRIGMIFV